jgi:uncharacterized protein
LVKRWTIREALLRTLDEIFRKKEARAIDLEHNLQRIVAQLRDMGARKIIVFGSLARGDIGPHSDLDLLAIMPASRTGREWLRKIYEEVDRGIACDIVAYNERELEEMMPVSRFLRHILREGEVVYEA